MITRHPTPSSRGGWERLVLRCGGAAAAALLLGLILVGLVHAHAQLVASEPREGEVLERGPQRVRLQFNEPIEPEFYALEVYAADRTRVDRRDARPAANDPSVLQASLGDLGSGTYTVVWRVLSIDGHVVRGAYAFTVGAGVTPGAALRLDLEANPTGNLAAIVRWLSFLAAFALVGGFAFLPLVLLPAHRASGLTGTAAVDRAARRLPVVAWVAVIALFMLGLAALVLQAADVTGVPLAEVFDGRALTRLLTGTKYGALWLARTGLLLGLLVVGVLLALELRPSLGLRWVGFGLGAAVLLSFSLGGHASAVVPATAVAVGIDWAHLLAGAIWVGGLLQLLIALPAALAALDAHGRRQLLSCVVPRFSLVAGIDVGVMVLTGVYSTRLHVPVWEALPDTVYGAALTSKLLLVAPLLGIAAVQLLVMRPRFVQAAQARAGTAEDRAGRRLFLGLVAGEVMVALAVLGVTGVLTGLPPAASEALGGRPFVEEVRVGDLSVGLEVTPNQAGTNQILISVPGARDVQRVEVAMSHLEMSMGTREGTAQPRPDGRYELSGNQLSMTGRWQIDVRLRQTAGEATARFTPVVGPAPGANRPAFSPARVLIIAVADPGRERSLPVNPRLVVVLATAAATALLVVRALSSRRRRAVASAAAASLAAVTLILAGTTVADAYQRSLPNPIPADTASLARGKAIYDASCAICHGDEGRGDGPAGVGLRPRPADFRVHMAAGHTDAELFGWISSGVAGTAMVGFADQLSETERWDAINYIRTFAAASR